MASRRRLLALAVAGGAVVALAAGIPTVFAGGSAGPAVVKPKAAGPVTGTCAVSTVAYAIDDTAGRAAKSSVFGSVPGTRVAFTVGTESSERDSTPSADTTCVVVHFSAESSGPAAGVRVRASLDGNTTAGAPDEVQLAGDAGDHVFVFPEVKAGRHTLRMQWAGSSNQSFQVTRTSVIVEYDAG